MKRSPSYLLLSIALAIDAFAAATPAPSFASCFALQPGVELATSASHTRIESARYDNRDVIAVSVTLSDEHGGGTVVQYHDPGTYRPIALESTGMRGLGIPAGGGGGLDSRCGALPRARGPRHQGPVHWHAPRTTPAAFRCDDHVRRFRDHRTAPCRWATHLRTYVPSAGVGRRRARGLLVRQWARCHPRRFCDGRWSRAEQPRHLDQRRHLVLHAGNHGDAVTHHAAGRYRVGGVLGNIQRRAAINAAKALLRIDRALYEETDATATILMQSYQSSAGTVATSYDRSADQPIPVYPRNSATWGSRVKG